MVQRKEQGVILGIKLNQGHPQQRAVRKIKWLLRFCRGQSFEVVLTLLRIKIGQILCAYLSHFNVANHLDWLPMNATKGCS